uniref:Retrovirus-related Pol polyprotein from transposon TNT 1-94 n=1 Tax=Tanacetum cinerariifolium TaxID=118510 RepID=A0A6L2P6B9_TANCI|nr:retrovirus-related Pol polyprotein from transposon TNT 1-94 [Tanacetum cinerariifolium]
MATVNDAPQLVEKKGGSYAAISPKLEPGKFNKWKKRMICYLSGIEPYYLKCIKDGPFKPKTAKDDANLSPNGLLMRGGKDYKAEYKKMKAKLVLLEASPLSPHNPKTFQPKNKGLVSEIFDWDKEEVSDKKEVTHVKVERLNPNSKLPNFNTGRILVPKSQAVNESLETLNTPKSSKDSKAKFLTPLPPLKNLQGAFPSSEILKAKAKPFPPCTHCGFNDHRPDDCRKYLECEICGSYDHSTSGHNYVIQIRREILAESSQSNESLIKVKCNTYGNTVHSTSNHNEFDHFKKETHQGAHLVPRQWMLEEYDWCQELSAQICRVTRMVENQNDVKVNQIRSDNGTEFRNHELESYCDEKGISQNFSSPYTPKQNGVAKRKNKTLIEAARTMLNGSVLSKHFWTDAVRIACYTQNRSIIVKRHDKTPYEIFKERIPDISYFHVFRCHVFIRNHKDYLGKFDAKADDGYSLGYSSVSKAFKVYNIRR